MKKVTIILGPPESGKTFKAKEMCKGKKSVWINNYDLGSPFVFREVDRETEFIVIDEFGDKDIERIKSLITSETIIRSKPGEWDYELVRPEVILTSNFYKESDFTPRSQVEIITLPERN